MLSAIGAISSTSTNMTTSVQLLSEETKSKLESLGVDTSNIRTEAQGQIALKSAQSTESAESTQSNTDAANKASSLANSQQALSAQQPEWISLMEQMGVSPTGSESGDVSAVNSAIMRMDPQQATTVASQFQAVGLSVASPQTAQQADMYAGQNQMAEMNKHFLIKQNQVA